ncbi:MAG TPA: glycoside hydrolase family 2 TIM barrel-domain containing protein [Edaphobacter sp.]|nr:glycoside hydrolase family 2 TIM barrel-domain containing protein [Edaphobacter sp.]
MSINRRDFLKTSGACVIAQSIAMQSLELYALPVDSSRPGHRSYPFDEGWLWSNMVPSGGYLRDFDDHSFQHVHLPHSNIFVPWHGTDQKSYQFVSLYRRHFTLQQGEAGRRVFVDFEGAMTASKVYFNGTLLGEYFGGFTPFSFELTGHLTDGDNVLAVELDSRELPEVPPFGYEVDYLTFGGIYRSVSLRTTGATFLDTLRVACTDALLPQRHVEAEVSFQHTAKNDRDALSLEADLLDGERSIASIRRKLRREEISAGHVSVTLSDLPPVELWDIASPRLYRLRVRLADKKTLDELTTRFGFREARFTPQGFSLNGKIIKLRGLNRHQTFPFAGAAMPARVQRQDAVILKEQLKCNIVRCSHYPQSHHFLDACDELGLLVIDETPGWQHVGESALWRERYLDNTRRMIRRDWNHPSLILWSVRINESRDFHDLYVKANKLAHDLDPSRQTTGVRYFQESELLEDVFSMNDFTFPLKTPNHPLYLNTEVVGAEFPVRPWDDNARNREHILRYAEIMNQINSRPDYAGVLGWCAFDYQTHSDFGSGDHICYHGVVDIFREPKPAAGFFRSQCSPSEEVVLEPGFHFAMNDQPAGFEHAVISSNCEQIRCFIGVDDVWHSIINLSPAKDKYPHLEHPPFFLTLPNGNDDWGDLRLDGYIGGKRVISRSLSGKGIDQSFEIAADDTELLADGSDMTRVALRVTDHFGRPRPLCFDPIILELSGPAVLVGETPLALSGGRSAVWIRSTSQAGTAVLHATHPHFGTRTLIFHITAGGQSST